MADNDQAVTVPDAERQYSSAETAVETTVSDIIERRNQSRDYMVANHYDELVDTYQAIKCRTKPFTKIDDKGATVEDKSRTNVAMPDLNIIYRRNVARMTAQPYQLRYTGGSDPLIAEALSAQASQQYDRSNEQREDRRVVGMSEAFGWGDSKLFWDNIQPIRQFRKALMKGGNIVYSKRSSIMAAQGATDDEIKQSVEQDGEDMSPQEIGNFIGKSGNEIIVPEKVKRYEGPMLKSLFPGDVHIEPGILNFDDSAYVIEEYVETDLWLQKMMKLTYKNDSGQDVKAFDPKQCEALLEMDPGPEMPDAKISNLRQMFRATLKQSTPWIAKRLYPNKRFDIMECHEQGEDGRMWITWVSEFVRDAPLGRMPYPWELYGKYAYTRLVPLPDLIASEGDSTPKLLRFIHMLLNFTYGQNFDYVTNLLKKFMLVQDNEDLADKVIDRGAFREMRVKDVNNIKPLEEGGLPPGAMERAAELWRILGLAEPSMNQTDAGTANNPQAGKTATTAVLAAKALDALTSWKIDGRNIYIRDIGQKKLWMNQQAATDDWEIESKHWTPQLKEQLQQLNPDQLGALAIGYDPASQQDAKSWVESSRYGRTAAIRLSPLDIQEDYQVEAEAGSYLAVDDDLRQSAANDLIQMAMGAPGILDLKKIALFKLKTIRGIGDPESYFLPPAPPPPPVPPKLGINIAAKADLPPDTINALLQLAGLPASQELQQQSLLNTIGQVSQAGDHVSNLLSPAVPPDPQAETANTPQGVDAAARKNTP